MEAHLLAVKQLPGRQQPQQHAEPVQEDDGEDPVVVEGGVNCQRHDARRNSSGIKWWQSERRDRHGGAQCMINVLIQQALLCVILVPISFTYFANKDFLLACSQ